MAITLILTISEPQELLADKILVIDDGTIVGNGTHNELLQNCEVYKEIYDSQGMGGDIDG